MYAPVFNDTYVAIINSPNILGMGCGFVDNGLSLSGQKCQAGLSRVLYNRNSAPVNSILSNSVCIGNSSFFSFTDTSSINSCIWNFGDINSGILNTSEEINTSHTYDLAGTYNVEAVITTNLCGRFASASIFAS